jgi:carbohydrate kinase (thermoresistant glucokinase family)
MMMQTAVTMGALPKLGDTVSWLPVDTVAEAVVDISLSEAGSVFTNVVNPTMFSWTQDLLPALRKAGLTFDEVEPKEWIARLRASNPDPKQNPPIKLVDFFASKYDKEDFAPSKTFVTANACALSSALANAPVLDQDLVNRFVAYFLHHHWKSNSQGVRKTAIVIAGPCGTGKSTVGSAMSSELHVPFIEGDSLHSKAAVEKMRAQIALCDEDRMHWFDRLCHHAEEALLELDYDSVVVSCSALKRIYRSHMREALARRGIRTIFVDLQASPDILEQRLKQRDGHYMSAQMVVSQSETYEKPSDEESDVLPIDAGLEKDLVMTEVAWCLGQVLAA